MRHAFDVTQAACFDQLAHLQHRRRRAAEVRATMHEREARRFRRKLDRPVERRVPAAEHHEPLAVKQMRIAHPITDVIALERFRARQPDAPSAGTNRRPPR